MCPCCKLVIQFVVGTFSVLFRVSSRTLFVSLVPKERYVEANSLLLGGLAMAWLPRFPTTSEPGSGRDPVGGHPIKKRAAVSRVGLPAASHLPHQCEHSDTSGSDDSRYINIHRICGWCQLR